MKSSKAVRTQNERSRKSNKRSEKAAKLDRKSSRGMIYENEELRLRTININAEVERGQTDIKRLRRENEHLRREIWTLRDECDRLNKRFKAKLSEHEYGGCRGSGGSGGCNARHGGGCDANSDDSDSCDTCRGDDDHCSDECCQEGGSCAPLKQPLPDDSPDNSGAEGHAAPQANSQPLQQHFDHLSVVSEETLSNPELLPQHHEPLLLCSLGPHGSQSPLPSLVGPLTPLTPIELVANQLNDLQATVPPLSYFENILQQHLACNMAVTPAAEMGSSSSTTSGRTMRHTNGWDYNLQSPFSQRKYSNNSSPARSPPLPAPSHLAPPILTTFVPTAAVHTMPKIALNAPSTASGGVETVAITTNAAQAALQSPKHFFAPMKPRLTLNTKMASGVPDDLPPGSPPPPIETPTHTRDPPDIFVNNALASPYQRQPARISPHVSPRHRARPHCQANRPGQAAPPCQVRQRQCQQQPAQHCALHRAVVDVAATVGLGVGDAVVDLYAAALASAAAQSTAPPSQLPQPSEPIYATAQKRCHSTCISATALTQPVMSVTTHSSKTSRSPLRQVRKPAAGSVETIATSSSAATTVDNGSQTDSSNLESILNDIETISEDILAIHLDRSKSRDNLTSPQGKDKEDQTKKPYRSEMNLYLQYDGTNPTISPATTAAATSAAATRTSEASSGSKLSRRTRSLEREHTDSPAPHMPDPMAPFPDKCSYLGFEQVNQAAAKQSPVQRPQTKAPPPPIGAKPSIPAKPAPPLPPARMNMRVPTTTPTEPPPPPPASISPNKSHLYKTLATAAAKRAIFRSMPSQLTRSLDVEGADEEATVEADDAEAIDAARRKARRVSIVCGEEQTSPTAANGAAGGGQVSTTPTTPTTTVSCSDLAMAAAIVLAHPAIKAIKQTSYSTPSSPHSSRRRTGSNAMANEPPTTGSAPPSTTHHHHRKDSSDPTPMTATVSRTKCSRRHSEGTVHNAHRISNASGGGGHHHHHNHHHQHSLISNNPHHSHHSHQDSNHETATSLSDRNSNSFASSRESSTSFSMRSTRRKISVSSHTGGKIPWCGCWGNGCL